MDAELTGLIIERRHRVPLPASVPGDGAVVARQLDAVLMSAGFKCSRDLFGWLSRADPGQVMDLGGQVIAAAWRMAGGSRRHNPYFRDFPFNVPATLEFWAELLEKALAGPQAAAVEGVFVETEAGTAVLALNLLSLPGTARYSTPTKTCSPHMTPWPVRPVTGSLSCMRAAACARKPRLSTWTWLVPPCR